MVMSKPATARPLEHQVLLNIKLLKARSAFSLLLAIAAVAQRRLRAAEGRPRRLHSYPRFMRGGPGHN